MKQLQSTNSLSKNRLKDNIDIPDERVLDETDLPLIYGRLQFQLQRYQTELQNKFSSVLENKLPEPKPPKILPSEPLHKKTISSTLRQSKQGVVIKNHEYIQGFLRDKYKIQSNRNEKKAIVTKKKPVHFRFSAPAKVIPREQRLNPFADRPRLGEEELSLGVFELMNRGFFPKNVDVTSAFEYGLPPFAKKNAMLHPFNEKLVKSAVMPQQNIFIDNKTFLTAPESFVQQVQQIKENTKENTEKNKTTDSEPHYKGRLEYLKQKESQNVIGDYSSLSFVIKNSRVCESNIFYEFKQKNLQNWEDIQQVIKCLENLFEEFDVRVAHIEGNVVARLALYRKKLGVDELLRCVLNRELVERVVKMKKYRFKGTQVVEKAANLIKAFFIMLKERKKYKQKLLEIKMVLIIQRYVRMHNHMNRTKEKIEARRKELINHVDELNKKLMEDWDNIKHNQRFEIHCNSFAYDQLQRFSAEKLTQKKNMQISRIFALRDPNVSVILILPFELNFEILNYYFNILEIGGCTDYKQRLHIILPENVNKFSYTLPTNRILLLSPFALKQISKIIGNKPAYIVPGYTSFDDVQIASLLNVPLFCGNVDNSFLFSTKVASRLFFNKLDLPVPPGATNFANEEEIYSKLALTIIQWILKISDENMGRGIATFTLDTKKLFAEHEGTQKELLIRIEEMLHKLFSMKLKIITPSLYRTYNEFIECFLLKGGVIEAVPPVPPHSISSPSISFIIEPNGKIKLLGSFEKISGLDYINFGALFPQKSLPILNVKNLCEKIGKGLKEQGIMGYINLDLISFPDPENPKGNLFWCIGLDCFLNNFTSNFFYFDFLMKGKIENNNYFIEKKDDYYEEYKEERCFMICPFLHHPKINSLSFKAFFHACRLEGISFDLEKKIGSTFLLVDVLQNSVISLLTIGDSKKQSIKFMTDGINFLVQQADVVKVPLIDYVACDRYDSIYMMDIVNKVRRLNKRMEKEKGRLADDDLI